MKVTINLDTSNDGEEHQLNLFFKAPDFYVALFDIAQLLRDISKGSITNSEEMYNEKLFEQLNEIISNSGMWEFE